MQKMPEKKENQATSSTESPFAWIELCDGGLLKSNEIEMKCFNASHDLWHAYHQQEKKKWGDIQRLHDVLFDADLEFHKMPCCDDQQEEYMYFLATAITKRLGEGRE